MELILIEYGLNAIVTLFFAYVAVVGGASAVKFIALDQEIRMYAKQQTNFINEMGDLFTGKFEKKMLRREKRIEDRIASFQGEPEKT